MTNLIQTKFIPMKRKNKTARHLQSLSERGKIPTDDKVVCAANALCSMGLGYYRLKRITSYDTLWISDNSGHMMLDKNGKVISLYTLCDSQYRPFDAFRTLEEAKECANSTIATNDTACYVYKGNNLVYKAIPQNFIIEAIP